MDTLSVTVRVTMSIENQQEAENGMKIVVTDEEENFRKYLFDNDYSKILNVTLKCTVCETNISWMLFLKKQIMIHPILDVLLCEGCLVTVSASNYNSCCLWCGSKPCEFMIRKCCKCSMRFCSSCIRLNFGAAICEMMELCREKWECFLCVDDKDSSFFVRRALCDAAQKMCADLKKIDENSTTNKTTTECVICTSELDTIYELKCKHKYHKSCISEWMKKNRTCPICRASYVD